MNVLFIHQNFPGQFKHLAPALAQQGHQVNVLTIKKESNFKDDSIHFSYYRPSRSSAPDVHPWLIDFETKVIRADACFREALKLKSNGYSPDVIVAHPGWGESLFLKNVWPNAKLGIYCEFYYNHQGSDVDFDKEFSKVDEAEQCRVALKNLNYRLHFDIADAAISPTQWQASCFPDSFQNKITVIHDGIDSDFLIPNLDISINLNDKRQLTRHDEVITFVNRNLEPYRGFHSFMRALPLILKQRPNAQIIVVGGDGVSYGAAPSKGTTWKNIFINEVRGSISNDDWQRVHFLGQVPYQSFIALMQLSTVHVYLTYPFVLSWSLLEAMSVGCAIVASNTSPVTEVIRNKETGMLVDFFDAEELAKTVCNLLENPAMRNQLGDNARELIKQQYDLASICLPKQIAWVESLLTL